MELKIIEAQLLRLQPGDLIVITLPEDTRFEELEYVGRALNDQFEKLGLKDKVGGLVVAGDIKLSVARVAQEG